MYTNGKRPPTDSVADRRTRARTEVLNGTLPSHYSGNQEAVVQMLNDALATELVCVLRYRRHYYMGQGMAEKSAVAEFLAHSVEELGHADLLAARIVQLHGKPDFHPSGLLTRSHAREAPLAVPRHERDRSHAAAR